MAPDLILVMARSPRADSIKRRLYPDLTDEQVRALYAALLLDTQDNLRNVPGACLRWICPPCEGSALCTTLGPQAVVEEVEADGFGGRLTSSITTGFAEGFQRILVTHADVPDLPTSYIAVARERLRDEPDKPVLLPALDGGFALLGLARRRPEWFTGIPWGSPQVANRLRDGAAQLGFPVAELPGWQDVDTVRDVADCLERGLSLHVKALARASLLGNGVPV